MNEPAIGRREQRVLLVAAAAFLAIHLGLGWVLRMPALGAGHDDAVYLLLGRELLGLSYRNSWIVGTPPATQYPPLYPLLLALSGATAPGGFSLGVGLNLLLSTGALALFGALAWRWSPIAAVAALAVAAVNPSALGMAGRVASEPAFGFFLYLTLWLVVAKPDRWYLALAAALAAAFTRSIGVAVVVGLLVHWVWGRRWRPAAWLAVAGGLTLGAWFARAALQPNQLPGQSYLADARTALAPPPPIAPETPAVAHATPPAPGPVAALARRIVSNAVHYAARDIPSILLVPTASGTIADNVLWLAVLLALGGIGAIALARRSGAWVWVGGAYLGILFVWPYVLERFLIPILPLVVCIVAEGARLVAGRIRRWAGPLAGLGLAAVVVITGTAADIDRLATQRGCDRSQPYRSPACFEKVEYEFLQAVDDVERLTPRGAVLLTPKAASVFYLVGRQAVGERYAASLAPDELAGFLEHSGVRHALVSRIHSDQATVAAMLRPHCAEWRVIASRDDGGSVLLRREASGDAPSACGPLSKTDFTRPPAAR